MARVMQYKIDMKIYKCIFVCVLSLLLAACMAGIEGLGGNGGDEGAPTLEVFSGDAQILLAWTPDPDSSPPESYELNRDDVQIFDGDATAYDDSPLTNATRYCYTVAAVIGSTLATSAQACATPMTGAALTVTNQSLAALLQWAAVPGAVSYNLYFLDPIPSLSLSKGTNKATGDDPINVVGTSYPMTGLSNNCVTYPVEIKPVDDDGNEGVASTQDASPDTEGTLDTSFGGGNGYVDIAAQGWFVDIAVMDDGTILALRRMTVTTDTLTAYDEDGIVLWEVAFSGGDHAMATVSSLAVDSEDRILIGGIQATFPKVCRLIASGASYAFDDAGFGGGGLSGCSKISTLPGVVHDITLDSQKRIVVSGQRDLGTRLTVWVLVNDGVNDGTLDTNFDLDGEYNYMGSIDVDGYAVETLFDGLYERIYVAGEKSGAGAIVLEIIDDNAPNAPTVTVSTDAIANEGARAIRIMDDGDPLIVGYKTVVPLMVYSWLYSNFVSPFTYAPTIAIIEIAARSLDVDCRERSVVAGQIDDGASTQMLVMRTDETLVGVDADFADVGWYVDNATNSSIGRAIERDSLGRLLIGGNSNTGVFDNPRLWRMK